MVERVNREECGGIEAFTDAIQICILFVFKLKLLPPFSRRCTLYLELINKFKFIGSNTST